MVIKYYRKKALQPMTPWLEDTDMTGVSISEADLAAGSPKQGDMIAFNNTDMEDKWLVAKKWFDENYIDTKEA
jgi:hypothetical protein